MRIRIDKRFLILVAVLGLPVAALLVFLVCAARNIEIPRTMELLHLSPADVDFSLSLPEGHMFEFLMDVPGKRFLHGEPCPFRFAGRCEIYADGALLLGFPLSSETAPECTWLDHATGNSAYTLTWALAKDEFHTRRLLQSGKRYHVKMFFQVPPRDDTSLWLSWLQRARRVPGTDSAKAAEKARMDLTVYSSRPRDVPRRVPPLKTARSSPDRPTPQ